MPKHVVDLYKASIKNDEKMIELNFVDNSNLVDLANLDVLDFFQE